MHLENISLGMVTKNEENIVADSIIGSDEEQRVLDMIEPKGCDCPGSYNFGQAD